MPAERLAERAAVALDPRLAEVWQLLWRADPREGPGVSEELLGALLRLAYVLGYADATGEQGDGSLYRELGLVEQRG